MTTEELITKATEDATFREQLKADPRATVAREFGAEIPDDVEITVLEETPKHLIIVLPAETSELSLEQLEGVAGGTGAVVMLLDSATALDSAGIPQAR